MAHSCASRGSQDWFCQYGRCYDSYSGYLLPIDEKELERLDLMHQFFIQARGSDAIHGLHAIPIHVKTPRILDLGCGTGIWAIDMADRYLDADIIGLDLHFSQPKRIPESVEFRQKDIEDQEWGLEQASMDLVHIRLMAGSIKDWPALYKNVFRHLKPGTGIIEHVEIDFQPLSTDQSLANDSSLCLWFQELSSAFSQGQRLLSLGTIPQTSLYEQGFTDINCAIKEIPYHPWPKHEDQANIGRWFRQGIDSGLEAMSMAALTRYKGYTESEAITLLDRVRKDISTRTLRSHCGLSQQEGLETAIERHPNIAYMPVRGPSRPSSFSETQSFFSQAVQCTMFSSPDKEPYYAMAL